MTKRTTTDRLAAVKDLERRARTGLAKQQKRYEAAMEELEAATALGDRGFVRRWRAVAKVLDERLWLAVASSANEWLATAVRVSRTRVYAKVKIARLVEQSTVDACGESVVGAAIALLEARRGRALTPDDAVDLSRVDVRGKKRSLATLTVQELEAERDRVLGVAVDAPVSVEKLRVVIASSAELAGVRVRFSRGRIAIDGVRDEQLVTLAPAIMLAVSSGKRATK
ncbi:MAG: hypothetical protein JNK05_36525 [Myxococcales bacterium]|nr:hypothetical protein [Myxococcales bacterium]